MVNTHIIFHMGARAPKHPRSRRVGAYAFCNYSAMWQRCGNRSNSDM